MSAATDYLAAQIRQNHERIDELENQLHALMAQRDYIVACFQCAAFHHPDNPTIQHYYSQALKRRDEDQRKLEV